MSRSPDGFPGDDSRMAHVESGMSITSLRGDEGVTDLLYGHRVDKDHERVEACGAVDELNTSLGVARSHLAADTPFTAHIDEIQSDLVGLMGELAVLPQDRERYRRDGFPAVGPQHVERLTRLAAGTEGGFARLFKDWARPGATGLPAPAFIDLARTVCRRAERRVAALKNDEGTLDHPEVLRFLNRLSDLLWLWARQLEEPPAGDMG